MVAFPKYNVKKTQPKAFCDVDWACLSQSVYIHFRALTVSMLNLKRCRYLTLKAPNKNCSRQNFNFLLLSFEENNKA